MKQLYGTYRPERLTTPDVLPNGDTRLGAYYPAMYLNSMFGDWNSAGLTNVLDMEIPEENYIGEIIPWVKKLTRFLTFQYDEQYVNPEELARSAENVGKRWDVDILTADEAYDWIKSNTNLQEVSPRKFLISEENEFMGQIIPAKYLELNS